MPEAPRDAPADLDALALPDLFAELTRGDHLRRLAELARDEDLGPGGRPGDVTSAALHDPDRPLATTIRVREPGCCAGLAALGGLRDVLAPDVRIAPLVADGAVVEAGAALAELVGPAVQVLAFERPMLNLLGRLCGVATHAAAFVGAVAAEAPGSRARLYDTRKTTPGLRPLEKYAVRCGGAWCHRIGLFDAVLLKDNHLAGVAPAELAAFVTEVAERARAGAALRFVMVEVDSLAQLESILVAPPGTVDVVLLDNMPASELRGAVELRDDMQPGVQLEASGGITLATVGAIARTGVDRISVGAITHGARWLDIGLDLV